MTTILTQGDKQNPGERLKEVLINNSELLAQYYKDPSLISVAGLPDELSDLVQTSMVNIKEKLIIPETFINKENMKMALTAVPEQEYSELSLAIDQQLVDFKFSSLDGVNMLSTLSGIGDGNFSKFLKNIFSNYFDNQSVIDKRAMISSYLTNSGTKDSNEMKLVGLLKGAGPYLQKMLQLFGDKAEGELKVALDELKTDLTPINQKIVNSILASIVDKSGGAISSIKIVGSLGAASVGQTVLANINWKNSKDPQEVVVKLLRPGIRLRADREVTFFKDEAKKIQGMLKTFDGISEQIEVEMDLQKEAKNVELAQVYNSSFKNLQAMKLVDNILSSQGYMVLEKAPGTTLKTALNDLEQQKNHNMAVDIGEKLASGIKALATKWVEEALFGSGFYHGDLHSGNIMFSPDMNNVTGMITVIDMGNAAVLSLEQKRAIFTMVLAAGMKKADVFVKNYEKVLSNEGKQLIVAKRDAFLAQTRNIMADTDNPSEIIVRVLSAANDIGLEIPATISNFSRSQMMLENAINKINSLNVQTSNKLTLRIEALASVCLPGEENKPIKDIHSLAKQKLEKLGSRVEEEVPLIAGTRDQLERLVKDTVTYQSRDWRSIDFSEVIMNVVQDHKLDSVSLAHGDIWKFISP